MTSLRVEYCGEWYDVDPEKPFGIGRGSDLVVDDNPYLHRVFLRIVHENGLWWLVNVGSRLSATVSAGLGQVQAWLAPGAKLPIVFERMEVIFSAGSTTYDFTIHPDAEVYETGPRLDDDEGITTTMMPVTLTASQRLLVVALAEQVLRQSEPGRNPIPSSADAAARINWPLTTFNRKLDNVCDKLDKIGVDGLRGGPGKLATNRRARLVEYAVATRLVGPEDLPLLDEAAGERSPS
ncbi:hypothetical protein [Homoserinibacter sp. YIM 151385]|uniref:hypothetical protein n=1 Tax=Homoserinibacter sp. YIM 151385 TaxID=2985506 RepID=UPI0022F143C2|nr:hypothetical protein [Homoserinibacter sp. YIM 151385]WBU39232.1 hypothetical protein OF852_06555 [Homoserinibacter sp. YIM 151385]